jgi:hypothetical protein
MNERSVLMGKLLLLLQFLILSNLFFSTTAHAYVDPGSGSVIVTTILGLFAAIGYTFRKYFYKTKKMFTKNKGEEENQNDE